MQVYPLVGLHARAQIQTPSKYLEAMGAGLADTMDEGVSLSYSRSWHGSGSFFGVSRISVCKASESSGEAQPGEEMLEEGLFPYVEGSQCDRGGFGKGCFMT